MLAQQRIWKAELVIVVVVWVFAAGCSGGIDDVIGGGTASGAAYEIGDSGPGGGIIFYDRALDPNAAVAAQSRSTSWRFLEAAPSTTEWVEKPWGGGSDHPVNTDTTVGSGLENTIAIMGIHGSMHSGKYAAKLCLDLDHGGHTDWFLPSLEELRLIQQNLYSLGTGGFEPDPGRTLVYYWSSSQDATQLGSARMGIFRADGSTSTGSNPKGHNWDNQRTRAIRRF